VLCALHASYAGCGSLILVPILIMHASFEIVPATTGLYVWQCEWLFESFHSFLDLLLLVDTTDGPLPSKAHAFMITQIGVLYGHHGSCDCC